MENKDKIEELEQRIIKIEERNKMVEGDKRWETSIIRHIFIILFTYAFAVSYIFVADTTNPFLGAIIPCVGFFLSTITIKPIKKWFLNKDKKNKKSK